MSRLTAMLAVLVLALSAPAFASGKQDAAPQAAAGAAAGLKEAPALAQLVKDGKLPPLAQRLPQDPLVVKPNEKTGVYGGTFRGALLGNDFGYAGRLIAYENLVRWSPDWNQILPNLASKWEVSPDATTFTFTLRRGLKWSDGAPFGVDDFAFAFEDVMLNPDLNPAKTGLWIQNKVPAKFEKIDDATFRLTLPKPDGFFIFKLAHYSNGMYMPKHYFQQFHLKYNKDVEELAKKEGFATWKDLFQSKIGTAQNVNVDAPVMGAWKWNIAPGKASLDRGEALRNPYYFKVDPEGKQLPYIDKMEFYLFQNPEPLVLKILGGEIDFIDQWVNTLNNKAVFAENQDRGGFRFVKNTMSAPGEMAIQFNLNHKDPARAALFRNKSFRIGMSHAINRPEIVKVVFLGQSTPAQISPRPESDLYSEKMAKQYLEFDPARANAALDQAGLAKKDGEGMRLGPDGRRLTIVFELDNARKSFIDSSELLVKQWKAVGVDVQVKLHDRALWEERVRRGTDWDATIHRFGGAVGSEIYTDPRYYFPYSTNSIFAQGWATWWKNPQGVNSPIPAVEPPDYVKKQQQLYDQLTAMTDPVKQRELMKQILDIATEQFYHVGVCWEPDGYAVVSKRLANVVPYPWSVNYFNPAPTNPSQYFFDPSVK